MSFPNAVTGTRHGRPPTVFLRSALLLPAYALAGVALVAWGVRIGRSGDTAGMPAAASPEQQRTLYGTPAGLYTAADIRANGSLTAEERYRGQTPRHDPRPAKGDRVCPITVTKADERFTWTVGGREYRFCCPACIDEFLSRARTSPGSILPPEQYVQR